MRGRRSAAEYERPDRLQPVVDELHELADEQGITLDEQLRIEAAIRAAHAGGSAPEPDAEP